MDIQLPFILILESIGLVLAIIAIWSFIWSRRTHSDHKIQAALESHLHGVLTAELEVVNKELKKEMQLALKDAAHLLKSNHEKLCKESAELLAAFAQTINQEMTQMLQEQHQHLEKIFTTKQAEIMHELELYRQRKIKELDAQSDEVLKKLLQRKVWRTLQQVDQHTVAKAAVQEIVSSGDLSV
jgi:hypothetical protein